MEQSRTRTRKEGRKEKTGRKNKESVNVEDRNNTKNIVMARTSNRDGNSHAKGERGRTGGNRGEVEDMGRKGGDGDGTVEDEWMNGWDEPWGGFGGFGGELLILGTILSKDPGGVCEDRECSAQGLAGDVCIMHGKVIFHPCSQKSCQPNPVVGTFSHRVSLPLLFGNDRSLSRSPASCLALFLTVELRQPEQNVEQGQGQGQSGVFRMNLKREPSSSLNGEVVRCK